MLYIFIVTIWYFKNVGGTAPYLANVDKIAWKVSIQFIYAFLHLYCTGALVVQWLPHYIAVFPGSILESEKFFCLSFVTCFLNISTNFIIARKYNNFQ